MGRGRIFSTNTSVASARTDCLLLIDVATYVAVIMLGFFPVGLAIIDLALKDY